jgi:FkbM family methyltransferase
MILMTLPKKLKDLRHHLFYNLLLKRHFKLVTLCAPGSICPWTICPSGLNAKSIVYSGGIGSDITFEHELVKQFGCDIVLCDPSPTGLKTMALPENKIPQFHYFPVALAAHSGQLNMAPPLNGQGNSWFARSDSTGKLDVPCTDLLSLMRQNHHKHIDLLKLDIEGSEYEVIDDFLKRRIPVRQICVEFHHGILPGFRRSQTIHSIFKLISRVYKLISKEGANHTFILGSPV